MGGAWGGARVLVQRGRRGTHIDQDREPWVGPSDAGCGKECAWCFGDLGRNCLGSQELEVQSPSRGVRRVGGHRVGEWKPSRSTLPPRDGHRSGSQRRLVYILPRAGASLDLVILPQDMRGRYEASQDLLGTLRKQLSDSEGERRALEEQLQRLRDEADGAAQAQEDAQREAQRLRSAVDLLNRCRRPEVGLPAPGMNRPARARFALIWS